MIIVLYIIIDQYMSHAYISALASLSQLPHHKGFSAFLKISLFYQAIYQYLLDNPVSRLSFVPTVIATSLLSNRLWAPVCPDFLWHSQAASVDEKDLTGLLICWGLRWSPYWITLCPQDLSQTSFGHIFINSSTILSVSMAMESP